MTIISVAVFSVRTGKCDTTQEGSCNLFRV